MVGELEEIGGAHVTVQGTQASLSLCVQIDTPSTSPKITRSQVPMASRPLSSPERVRSTVRPAAVIGCRHKNEFFSFIDLVKEAPRPYAVSPGGGLPILQPFDIRTKVRLVSEL